MEQEVSNSLTDDTGSVSDPPETVKILGKERLTVKQIFKNVIIVSVALTMLFTSYNGLANLQSSLHIDEGMGVVTQAVLHGSMIISGLFLPTITIRKLGHKWTLTLSMIGYIIWMVANGYAVWATMIPASIIVGLCAGPLWTAESSYFGILAHEYGRLQNQSPKAALAIFFGIFHAIFPLSGVFGSIVSSTVLNQKDENYTGPTDEDLQWCGMNDCPWYNSSNVNYEETPTHVLWTLVGIYLAISLIALIIAVIFIDPIPSYLLEDTGTVTTKTEVLNSVGATAKHLRHISQLLLIVLSSYNGFKSTFLGAEYNKSWVTCNLGIWMVGLVTMPFSVALSITSLCAGRMVKYTGRLPIFITGFGFELIVIFTLIFWETDPDQLAVFFMIPTLWGIADGLWQVQVGPLYGALFPREMEPAYSNNNLWMAVGYTIAFAYSAFLCTSVKLYIVLGVLLVAMLGYFSMEIREARKEKGFHSVYGNAKHDESITGKIKMHDKY